MDSRSFLALATLPALLLLGGAGCSNAAQDGAAAFDGGGGGTEAQSYDDDGVSGGDADDGYPGGTGGAGDDDDGGPDGDAEPLPDPPDDPATPNEPPVACNDVDEVTLYLSPDDSNSISSPVQAREAALDGFSSVKSVPIRTWEFMNYYAFDYPAAEPGGVVVTPSLMQRSDGAYTMQIGVSSQAIGTEDRAPMNVTLVLDGSGSMSGHPMDMLKETCRAIASSLKAGDVVSMVTWDTSNAIVLGGYTVQGPNDPMLLEKIEALQPGGGTDLNGGLTAGYMLAEQAFDAARINRIVLISDGGANAGVTDIDLIAEHAGTNNGDGIYLVGVGVGTAGSYHDHLMDTVTDAGKGASVFVNDEAEAWKIFSEDFVATMSVAVRDVHVRLDLPPGFEVVKFSGEEISGDPSEVEPQHLAPNDAMVFHQQIETCAPDLVADDAQITVSVEYLDAVTFEQREASVTTTFGELLAQDSSQLLKGAAVFAYAESLKAYKKAFDLDESASVVADALTTLTAAEAALPEDPDLAEIRTVLEAL